MVKKKINEISRDGVNSPMNDFTQKMERLNALNSLWSAFDLDKNLPEDYKQTFKERFDDFMKDLINAELGRDSELPPYMELTDKHMSVLNIMIQKMGLD